MFHPLIRFLLSYPEVVVGDMNFVLNEVIVDNFDFSFKSCIENTCCARIFAELEKENYKRKHFKLKYISCLVLSILYEESVSINLGLLCCV